jgi:hypothetical protein
MRELSGLKLHEYRLWRREDGGINSVTEKTQNQKNPARSTGSHFGRGTVLVHHHSYDQFYIGNSDPRQQVIPTETPPILMDTQLCWVKFPEDVEQLCALVNVQIFELLDSVVDSVGVARPYGVGEL